MALRAALIASDSIDGRCQMKSRMRRLTLIAVTATYIMAAIACLSLRLTFSPSHSAEIGAARNGASRALDVGNCRHGFMLGIAMVG